MIENNTCEAEEVLKNFNSNKPFTVRRDDYGYAVAICRDGWDIIHLNAGTTRNELMVDKVVELLNQ